MITNNAIKEFTEPNDKLEVSDAFQSNQLVCKNVTESFDYSSLLLPSLKRNYQIIISNQLLKKFMYQIKECYKL